MIACALILTAAIGYQQARSDTHGLVHQYLEHALAVARLIDQETTAAENLLTGLSRSPALAPGRLVQFHKQLIQTPMPKGVWIALADLDHQLVNSRFPFDVPLPKITNPEWFKRVRREGFYVTT